MKDPMQEADRLEREARRLFRQCGFCPYMRPSAGKRRRRREARAMLHQAAVIRGEVEVRP